VQRFASEYLGSIKPLAVLFARLAEGRNVTYSRDQIRAGLLLLEYRGLAGSVEVLKGIAPEKLANREGWVAMLQEHLAKASLVDQAMKEFNSVQTLLGQLGLEGSINLLERIDAITAGPAGA
jgi:hypothetical protein